MKQYKHLFSIFFSLVPAKPVEPFPATVTKHGDSSVLSEVFSEAAAVVFVID